MSNDALKAALSVSLEELEAEEAQAETLLETLVQEANDLTPQEYIEDRIAVEQDIQIIDAQADQLQDAVEVSHEQLDGVIALVNAVAGRYAGFKLKSTGMEGVGDAKERVAPTVAQLRELSVALESALTVTMEEYALKDLWDQLGILNREIPELKDRIAVLNNYDGKTRLAFGGVTQIFTVDGVLVENLGKAAGDTASILEALLKVGEDATSTSQKAANIAYAADWADATAAEKALKQISALPNQAKEAYSKLDSKFVMGNRTLTVKKFAIKGGDELGNWAEGATLKLSWPKSTTGSKVATVAGAVIGGLIGSAAGVGGAVLGAGYASGVATGMYQGAQAMKRRNVDIKDLTAALNKIKDCAVKSAAIRNNAPKKWREHELMVKKLKSEVRGNTDAALAVRAISEQDRLGWECLNAAFSILWFIIREINTFSDSVTKKARKDQRD